MKEYISGMTLTLLLILSAVLPLLAGILFLLAAGLGLLDGLDL